MTPEQGNAAAPGLPRPGGPQAGAPTPTQEAVKDVESDWWVPPQEALDNMNIGFAWVPGPDAKPRRVKKPGARDVRPEDLQETDFYEALEWYENLVVTGFKFEHLWKQGEGTEEDRKFRHDKIQISFQTAPGAPTNNPTGKVTVFLDFYWKLYLVGDQQLKQLGENKRPLAGRKKQTDMSQGFIIDMMKATGHGDKLSQGKLTDGFKQVPWNGLINRVMRGKIRNEEDLDGALQARVQRVEGLKKKR